MLKIIGESLSHPEILHIESGNIISLPHGSGIDCDWSWKESEGECLMIYNEYHAMDANGYYCGYIPFGVIITYIEDKFHFDVCVSNNAIDRIMEDYEADVDGESNAPYLDDLGDVIYSAIDCWANYTEPRLRKERSN